MSAAIFTGFRRALSELRQSVDAADDALGKLNPKDFEGSFLKFQTLMPLGQLSSLMSKLAEVFKVVAVLGGAVAALDEIGKAASGSRNGAGKPKVS